MEVDRHTALLQGAFLARSKSLIDQVFEVFNNENVDRRKLLLCLLVNSKLLNEDDLSPEMVQLYRPFFCMWPQKIELSEMKEILDRLNLWKIFVECLPFLVVCQDFHEMALASLQASRDPFASTAYIAGLIKQLRLQDDASATTLLELLVGYNRRQIGKLSSHRILDSLYLAKIALTPEVKFAILDSCKSDAEILDKYFGFGCDGRFCKEQPIETLKSIDNRIIEKIMNEIFILAKSIRIDDWMNFVDENTKEHLDHPVLRFWSRDDFPPSNLQLMIANYFYEVSQLSNSISLPADGLAVMKGFGRLFDKRMELHLDQLQEPQDIMDKIKSVMVEPNCGWKVEAYVEKLSALESDRLANVEILEFLCPHSMYLTKNLQKFYQLSLHLSKQTGKSLVREKSLQLLATILSQMSFDDGYTLFSQHFSQYQFSTILKSDEFIESCRVMMNRASLQQTENSDRIIWLCLQSPLEFFHFLLDEACENGGKIPLAASIIFRFRALNQISVLAHLRNKFFGSCDRQTITNATQILRVLADHWRKTNQTVVVRDLVMSLFEYMIASEDDDVPFLTGISVLIQGNENIFEEAKTKLVLIFGLCSLLNHYYDASSWNSNTCETQQLILSVLHSLVNKNELALAALKKSISPRLVDYFYDISDFDEVTYHAPSESVKILQRFHFSDSRTILIQVSDEAEKQLFSVTLAAGFSEFLPKDFSNLGTSLKLVLPSDDEDQRFTWSPVSELLMAAELFFASNPELSDGHMEYISNSLSLALASSLESCGKMEVNQLQELFHRVARIVHTASCNSDRISHGIEMCLINLVNQIIQEEQTLINLEDLVAHLHPLPKSDARMMCLAKIQLLIETC